MNFCHDNNQFKDAWKHNVDKHHIFICLILLLQKWKFNDLKILFGSKIKKFACGPFKLRRAFFYGSMIRNIFRLFNKILPSKHGMFGFLIRMPNRPFGSEPSTLERIRISNRPFGSEPSTGADQNIKEIAGAEHSVPIFGNELNFITTVNSVSRIVNYMSVSVVNIPLMNLVPGSPDTNYVYGVKKFAAANRLDPNLLLYRIQILEYDVIIIVKPFSYQFN